MNRRTVMKYLGTSGLVASLGSGVYWLTRSQDHSKLAVKPTLERLKKIHPEMLETNGVWDVARTFNHLAQSIEFSMTGYPVMKPKLFQNTVGQLAFAVFQAQGHMIHSLDEAIPGEIVSATASTPTNALDRLVNALEYFDSFDGALKPHFAYGALNKPQYAVAHVLHINNHFEDIRSI